MSTLDEILKDYNGYDFCGEKSCNGQRKARELKQAISDLVDGIIGEDDTKDFNNIGRNNLRAEMRKRKKEAGL